MITNKNIFILSLLVIVLFVSCNTEIENKTNKESKTKVISNTKNFSEGEVKYKFELDIPSNKDDGIFAKIVQGAIESLVEKVDPKFSLHFKDKRAKLNFDNINLFDKEIKIDSLNGGIKLYDFNAGNEINFEIESDTKIARIKKIQNVKYNVVYSEKEKSILDYICKQAFLIDKDDEDTTTIWYTPEINIPLSPFEYTGIEGLALELTLSGIHIYATSVISQSQSDSIFIVPDNFEKIFE